MTSCKRIFSGRQNLISSVCATYLLENFPLLVDGSEPAAEETLPVIIVPGSRALRSLKDALMRQGKNKGIAFPRIVTPGGFPELLCSANKPLASPVIVQAAFVSALKTAEDEILQVLYSRDRGDIKENEWWQIAREMMLYYQELEASLVNDSELLECVAKLSDNWDLELARWQAFFTVREAACSLLLQNGYIEKNRARRTYLSSDSEGYCRPVVIAGVPELSAVRLGFLKRCSNVTSIIQADEEEKDYFDAYGQPLRSYWLSHRIDFTGIQLLPAQTVRDEAVMVASTCRSIAEKQKELPVICTADPARQIQFATTLKEYGLAAHYTEGLQMKRSSLALFLKALAAAGSDDWTSFSPLLRFPFIAAWYENLTGTESAFQALREADKYYSEHLPFLMKELNESAPAIVKSVKAHFDPVFSETHPLNSWPEVCGPLLHQVVDAYYQRQSEEQKLALRAGYVALQNLLLSISQLPLAFSFPVSGNSFLSLLNQFFSELTVGQQQSDGIEMLGWLEALHDDSLTMLITGVNEGMLPESITCDAWLPHSVRDELGIRRNDDRYARDIFILDRLLQSRNHVYISYALYGQRGEPLKPGRILYAVQDENLGRRVHELFSCYEVPRRQRGNGSLASPLVIPPPILASVTPGTMSVSAFKQYLQDPYRFYLRYIERLRSVTDTDRELNALQFGTVAHSILETFARAQIDSPLTEQEVIFDFVKEITIRAFREKFGKTLLPAVQIQREQLISRLWHFAVWQAKWHRAGNSIYEIELDLSATLDVDGIPLTITGKIDRIDRAADGRPIVFDYKTSETPGHPASTHRNRNGEWRDLQLPLYRFLLQKQHQFNGEELIPGYLPLSQHGEETRPLLLDPSKWDESLYAEAIDCARDVVRKVRQFHFPPAIKVQYEDEFSNLIGEKQRIDPLYDRECAK